MNSTIVSKTVSYRLIDGETSNEREYSVSLYEDSELNPDKMVNISGKDGDYLNIPVRDLPFLVSVLEDFQKTCVRS